MGNQSSFSSLTIGLIIASLLIGAGGGYFAAFSSFQPRIGDLEDQVATMTLQVNDLTTALNQPGNDEDDLESQASILESQVTGLQSQITGLSSQISDLESELGDAQETLSQRDESISELGTSLGEKNVIIDEKDAIISELESTLADYEDQIESLAARNETSTETDTLSSIDNWLYQLQEIDVNAVGETGFDLIVIDYSQDGDEETRFTRDEISALKDSPGGSKIVLAYMSIGEAEDYRWYWQNAWDRDGDGTPDFGAPSWLGPSNPDWVGNYKVRYWEESWQSIIYGSADSYLDQIISSGFDGVYLDIIDGEALADYSEYVQVVSGIGKEDTWYDDDTPQPDSYSQEVIEYLNVFSQAGKLVLVVDYVTETDLIDSFYLLAESNGYVPYSTDRELDRITINPGHLPA